MKFVCFSLVLVLFGTSFAANPFAGVSWYVNPTYVKQIGYSVALHPSEASLLRKAALPTFYWIDRMAKIPNMSYILEGAKNELAMFVVYDLPDRDCAAAASNGEILCADSSCTAGISTYKTHYIDPIVSMLSKYPNNRVVAIVEPDSLPNLATNLNVPKCSQAQTAYKTGVSYAIQELAKLSNVALYVDAAHGGWLGWPNNLSKYATIIQDVLGLAGGQDKIRGFSTNVANYQPLGSMSSTADPCNLKSQYNNAINEVIYVSFI